MFKVNTHYYVDPSPSCFGASAGDRASITPAFEFNLPLVTASSPAAAPKTTLLVWHLISSQILRNAFLDWHFSPLRSAASHEAADLCMV
jgi:hypothetical protein